MAPNNSSHVNMHDVSSDSSSGLEGTILVKKNGKKPNWLLHCLSPTFMEAGLSQQEARNIIKSVDEDLWMFVLKNYSVSEIIEGISGYFVSVHEKPNVREVLRWIDPKNNPYDVYYKIPAGYKK